MTRPFRKSTIREVATQAGVSITTVSLFVSGREDVCSTETGQRIRHAVSELNYTPNWLSRGLRRMTSTTIGVCLPTPIDNSPDVRSRLFEGVWHGITQQADHENYSLLHYPLSVRAGREPATFLDGRIDGLLMHSHSNDRAERAAAAGLPLVLLARSIDLPAGCGAVWVDERQVCDTALSYLWDLGHRRIAHVTGPVGVHAGAIAADAGGRAYHDDIAVRRLDAYKEWMDGRCALDPALIGYARDWTAPQAPEILALWGRMENPPTAILCACDTQALDVIAAARAAGLRVPTDLSVIGIENAADGRENMPSLTSVHIAAEEIGRAGVKMLIRLMAGAAVEHATAALPLGRLVVRSSTGTSPAPQAA